MSKVKLLNEKAISKIWEVRLEDNAFYAYAISGLFFVTQFNHKMQAEIQINPDDKNYDKVWNLISNTLKK